MSAFRDLPGFDGDKDGWFGKLLKGKGIRISLISTTFDDAWARGSRLVHRIVNRIRRLRW